MGLISLKGLVEKVYRAFKTSVGKIRGFSFSFVSQYIVHVQDFKLARTCISLCGPAVHAGVAAGGRKFFIHVQDFKLARISLCGPAVHAGVAAGGVAGAVGVAVFFASFFVLRV